MSEYDHHEEERRKPAAEARVHIAKWSAWIWIVPAVAVFIAGWLVVRYGFFGGGDITVRFAEARGLDRYSPVRFRGAKVGTVQKITIDQNLGEVVVRITMDASMNHALKTGTRFWIVEPGLESGGLGGLLSGTYVGIAPGTGDDTRDFVGQEYAPVLSPPEKGLTVILEGQGVGAIEGGTPVVHGGMRVGRVLGTQYDEKRGLTSVYVFIVQRFANEVRQSTRFWRAGGLNVQFSGAGLSMGGGGGIASLLSSPVTFSTPEVLAGAPVANGTRFQLYESQVIAESASEGPQIAYVTYFPGSVHGLVPGTAVQMKGVLVGRVRDVTLRYVPQTATLETPVTIEIDPRKLQLPVSDQSTPGEIRAELNDALAKLVQKGLRATLSTSLVLPGAGGVGLDMVGKPGTARLAVEHDPPIIPAAQTNGGIEGALGAVNDIAARIRNLPIEEIAGHLRSTTARIDTLVHDKALDESVQRLNRSLADLEVVTKTARENVGPITKSLRDTAAAAEAAAGRATQLMGNGPRQNYDLGNLIEELTKAALAVRTLANYLEENPDALIKGRGK
ncbi:MAG TPA: MlaD family protein [Thermoanaerobaculia bacterium]|nr:MlaD family protein [Thermoanaerobaculia bacterium]